ncbi:nitroreductase family protein [Streptomyces anulatus]
MTDHLRTALASAYAHGPGKSIQLSPETARPARSPASHAVPMADLAGIPSFGPALVRTLTAALAPRRWEPWNPHNDHRAYPSPRCVYLTQTVLRFGQHRWPIDPVRLVLEGERQLPAPATVTSATVELTVDPSRLPAGYGTLREALALLETGHLSSALVEAGRATGLAACASAGGVGGASGTVAEVTLGRAMAPTWPWHQVAAARSAALTPRGLSADPRPLPTETLRRVVQDSRPPSGSLADRRGTGGLRHRLAVRGVTDVRDGLYELDDDVLVVLDHGRATRRIQSAFRYGPADVDVTGMNLVWIITADVDDAVRGQGPDGYQNLLLTVGAAAQHVCSAAAAAGLFCRPVRSFDEAATEAAVQAHPAEDIVYMLLIGRPRALDFCYELTDPEDPIWR